MYPIASCLSNNRIEIRHLIPVKNNPGHAILCIIRGTPLTFFQQFLCLYTIYDLNAKFRLHISRQITTQPFKLAALCRLRIRDNEIILHLGLFDNFSSLTFPTFWHALFFRHFNPPQGYSYLSGQEWHRTCRADNSFHSLHPCEHASHLHPQYPPVNTAQKLHAHLFP